MLVTIVVAFDKFRGTATARELCEEVANRLRKRDLEVWVQPMSDGGEGFGAIIGSEVHLATVSGPLGLPTQAHWYSRGDLAIVEMAEASGLAKVGVKGSESALSASTRGTGELIELVLDQKFRRIVIGCGGSASTDGGAGALEVVGERLRRDEIEVTVAVDVATKFLDAARVFGPQKGATPEDITILTERLQMLAESYVSSFGIDVREIPGTGAAGGLAGGLVACGAQIRTGVDVVSEHVGLREQLSHASLVVTGEGCLDGSTGEGKVVGALVDLAGRMALPVLVVAGTIEAVPSALALYPHIELLALVERYGEEEAFAHAVRRVGDRVLESELLGQLMSSNPGD